MAVDSMVKRLLDERDQKMTLIEQISGVADEAGRDLFETESETIANAQSRVRSLNAQVDQLSQDLELADSAKNRIRALDPSVIARDFTYRSAGDLMYDLINRSNNADCNLRLNRFMSRAAEHMGMDKATTVPVAGGFNGLVVIPTIGPVLDPSPKGRPLFTALGAQPAPAVKFNRPRIIDAALGTGVAPVTTEKSEMVSKAFNVDSETVTCGRVGGYLNFSEVADDWVSGSFDMVVNQMNRRLARYSETAVVTQLATTTATVAVATNNVNAAIGTAAALVFTNTGELPEWLAMGPAGWGALIGTADLAGRPLFPSIGAVNATGTASAGNGVSNLSGLNVVVTPGITDKTMYIGNSSGLELYERPMPLMQAYEPSVYGRQIAVVTYIGFYSPITTEAGPSQTPPAKREGTVKITWA
jgi:outer membrane murein-binding lipoprotein Lpp